MRKIKKNHEKKINEYVKKYEEEIITHLNDEYAKKTKWSDRIADKIASFGGSWKFIILFALFLVFWMIWNTLRVTKSFHYDEPPFILLNLILSFIAAFQAPIIMMSQNRQSAKDKDESIIDFAINYKSQEEINDIQGHLHRLEKEVTEIKSLLEKMHHKNETE